MDRYADHKAWERVKRKKAFYGHLSAFLGVNLGLFAMNAVVSPGHWWFQYTTMGWGIGLVIHYFTVFGIPVIGPLDEKWEQEEYKKELGNTYSHHDEVDEYLDLDEVPALRKRWRDSDLV